MRFFTGLTLCAALAACTGTPAPDGREAEAVEYIKTPFTDEWPAIKANGLRNSQSLLPGAITKPEVLAAYRYGNYRGYFLLEEKNGAAEQALPPPPAMDVSAADIEDRYGFYGLRETVNGGLLRWNDANNGRYLHLYPGQLNYLFVTESFDEHLGTNTNRLEVYRVIDGSGGRELLWQTPLPYYHERPHIAIADMNGDGVTDIVVEGWEGVTVYDSKTRQVIMDLPQSQLHNSRKRGYILLRDIKGDGFPDVVILDIYPWDVNVIDNDGKKLSVNWFKIYDNHIESAEIITAYPRDPVNDHRGKGRMEMIFNIWNETGDGAWHVKALDAETGGELFDLPRSYLHDTLDLNGDGRSELFVSTPSGIDVPGYSEIKILDMAGNTLFREPDAKWVFNYESYGIEHDAIHGGTTPKAGMKYVVTQGARFFLYKRENAGTRIYRGSLNGRDGGFSLYYPGGSEVELINSRDGRVLLEWNSRFSAPPGAAVQGAALTPLCWGPAGNQQYKLPIIADLGGPSNSIVLGNNVGQVVRLDYREGRLVEGWAVEGYGAAEQYAVNTDFGVAAADFNGDGKKEIALRVDGKAGGGIRVVDARGETLWQTDFPLFPSGKPTGFSGILGYYTAVNVKGKTNLVVSGQRHVQHTGISYGLDGATGEILWSLDVVNKFASHRSGAGSFYLSVFDLDGDGVDEVMTGYGNNLWAAGAATGETFFEKFMTGLMQPWWIAREGSGWLSQILPIPVRHGWPVTEIFFAHGGDSHGLGIIDMEKYGLRVSVIERSLTVAWANRRRNYTNRTNQCVFEFEGKLLIAEPARTLEGAPVIRALDPLDGEDLGEPCLIPENADPVPIACDVDGDGRQEIVYTARTSVSAIRFDGTGWTRVWTLDLGERLSWPVYGDVTGDGAGEIVVSSAAGMAYVIGGGKEGGNR
ncbi:MAG: VCBS repeat-containing protein [Treponema sp.]|jgi:hypothetical protein|nr:VCBS repeat-containing protein [Treponema sp.]